MKLDSTYSVKPPSVHGWMRKDYCPRMERLLSNDNIQRLLSDCGGKDTYTLNLINPFCLVAIEVTNVVSWGARKFLREMRGGLDNGVRLKVYFRKGMDDSDDFTAVFHLDEAHLLPYLFKLVESKAIGYDVVLVPEHRDRLGRLGIIEKGFFLERGALF